MGAEHHVDPWRPAQHAVLVLLGQAAPDRDLHVRVAALVRRQVAQIAVELVVGVLPHRAGVEHHQVGVGALGGAAVSGRLQHAGDALGVVDVHLAAVGTHLIGAHLFGNHRRTHPDYGTAVPHARIDRIVPAAYRVAPFGAG